MKTIQTFLLAAGLATSLIVRAAEAPPATGPAAAPAQPAAAPATTPAAVVGESATGTVRLNFRNARLDQVLDYLSDAAGFIINKQTDVHGTVDVWSKEPVTKEEAVELLDSVLNKNGCAVIRNNRILTIVSQDTMKNANTEIISSSDPNSVDGSDTVVTQIIPVRYASASQLLNNLQVLLPTSSSLSVNESANSLILVATQRDIKRMLKIIRALDTSIASVSSIKVFQLRFADAKQLATEIQALFTPQASQGGGGGGFRNQLFNMFRGGGGGGGGGPGGFGGPGGGAGGGSGGSGGVTAKVSATSDDYSNSLIVSAPSDLLSTIADMVQQIDVATTDVTELRYFHLLHADPVELADQFAQLFPDTTRSASDTTGGGGFGGGFRFGGPFGRGGNNQATSNDRTKKKSQVLAVADPRTRSLLVSAASELMPHIAEMIEELDRIDRPEVVSVIDLKNADPQDVGQVLDDLFHRTGQIRSSASTTSKSLLGTANPLTQRSTATQVSPSATVGNSSGRGAGGINTGF